MGSGKTLLFLLPILECLLERGTNNGPEALVLVPAVELAEQRAAKARALTSPAAEPPTMAVSVCECVTAPTASIVFTTAEHPLSLGSYMNLSYVHTLAIDEVDATLNLALHQPDASLEHANSVLAVAAPDPTSIQYILTTSSPLPISHRLKRPSCPGCLNTAGWCMCDRRVRGAGEGACWCWHCGRGFITLTLRSPARRRSCRR